MWSCKTSAGIRGLLVALLLLIGNSGYAQQLQTTFSHEFSRWQFDGETFYAIFNGSYDQWRYKDLTIRTTFPNNWNTWNVGNDVRLKTVFNNSFDQWEITGHNMQVRVQSTFSGDHTNWRISGDVEGQIRATFIDDLERWSIDIDFDNVPDDIKAAILLVPIYTGFRTAL